MFVATALLYPCALAGLCVGAGLAVDRASGSFLPTSLLVSVGAAALIGLSQLSTYLIPLAPATPYLMLALALAGLWFGRARLRTLGARCRERPGLPAVSLLAYALALAPVLAGGRPSFSSYMALADSAVHMLGADFLIRHGQDYAHLDLTNSYGQFVRDYYGMSYPSGADTLFGGSSMLLGLPLIWAFQPFNAFMLASAAGPAWLLVRRLRLTAAWAALAVLTIVVPALVYGYELLGSVKEIAALSMLLTLGALTVAHRSWLDAGGPARALPFALVLAAGLSALGPAFGAWALAAVLVLASMLARPLRGGRRRRSLLLLGMAALTLLVAAWPTWRQLPSALRIANVIASTGNAGNLHAPLRASQVLGIWLNGSYKLAPAGTALVLTDALIALALAAVLLGGVYLLRIRAFALVGWVALTLLASMIVSRSVSTWAEAKTLVLTSPVAVLLVWAGVAAVVSQSRSQLSSALAAALAACILGGVLASDALQYHSSNLAPTARYEELASLDARFSGRGPTLFTDFDEYSLYELRQLDVGGPDFIYPPSALAAAAGGYGRPVDLQRIAPSALARYALIVMRREPGATRPSAAYRLVWQGSYYQVWARSSRTPPARTHLALSGSAVAQCKRIGRLAARFARPGERLIAAQAPTLVRVPLARALHPSRWGHEHGGFAMKTPGRLTASFALPSAGVWELWLQGQFMPSVRLSVDGRPIAAIAGQLDGNSLVPDTVPPFAVRLRAGEHRVSVSRSGFSLAPGAGGEAVLHAITLTPARSGSSGTLRTVAPADWRSLCGRSYQWIELVGSIGAHA